MSQKTELYVIDGDYGLPSFDIECIKSILFTKVAKVPVTVKLRNSIKSCCMYSAPTLLHDKTTFTEFRDITKHLRTLHYNIDCGLTSKQASDSCAMESFVTSTLNPVVAFVQWVELRNRDELTVPWFMKALPVPFNYAHVKQKKEAAVDLMETLYPDVDLPVNLETLREYIRKLASNALSTLSTKLGTSRFFYGDSPSTLDVIVYAYLAPLMKIPYPSTEITGLLGMWPNLTNFVKRIDIKYFSDLNYQTKYIKKKEKVQQNDDEISYVGLLILFTSASTIMLCFAINKGIIQFSSS